MHASEPLPKFTLACVQHCRPSMLSCLQVHLDGDFRPVPHPRRSVTSHSPRVCVFPQEGAPELRSSGVASFRRRRSDRTEFLLIFVEKSSFISVHIPLKNIGIGFPRLMIKSIELSSSTSSLSSASSSSLLPFFITILGNRC